MEYFTRAAYESTDSQKGRRQWNQLEKDYAAHLRSITPLFKNGWRYLARESFEDEFIRGIERPSFDQLAVELGDRILVFNGIRSVRLPDADPTAEDLAWLCHEIHMVEEGVFELKVLLAEGEFRVACEEIEVRTTDETDDRLAA
ncbi:MAG: hypothetical protein FJ405_03905 [Verrucomicrobia bacterium]|nr:hypothetical protein [Verrucomicrobiota bacterium]